MSNIVRSSRPRRTGVLVVALSAAAVAVWPTAATALNVRTWGFDTSNSGGDAQVQGYLKLVQQNDRDFGKIRGVAVRFFPPCSANAASGLMTGKVDSRHRTFSVHNARASASGSYTRTAITLHLRMTSPCAYRGTATLRYFDGKLPAVAFT